MKSCRYLVQKVCDAKKHFAGNGLLVQLYYGKMDMMLHSTFDPSLGAEGIFDCNATLPRSTGCPACEGNHFLCSSAIYLLEGTQRATTHTFGPGTECRRVRRLRGKGWTTKRLSKSLGANLKVLALEVENTQRMYSRCFGVACYPRGLTSTPRYHVVKREREFIVFNAVAIIFCASFIFTCAF